MDPKRVAEIEQMLTNRHDMLHYNMKALRRAGLDLLVEAKRLSENIQAYAFESGRVSLKCQDQSKEIESLKRQLALAAKEAAKGCCPYDADKAFALICNEYCSDDDTCSERCWLEYWRQQSGAFQNGNNQSEAANG